MTVFVVHWLQKELKHLKLFPIYEPELKMITDKTQHIKKTRRRVNALY